MKSKIFNIKKNCVFGFIGIETAIISALIVTFSLIAYNFLKPSFVEIAISIKNSVTGTY